MISISTSGYIPKRMGSNESNRDMHTTIHSTVAKRWGQPKNLSTDQWINRVWFVETMKDIQP